MKWSLILCNIIFLVAGQLAWKQAVKNVVEWNLHSFLKVFLSIPFIAGGILYVLATGVWLVLLSKYPLGHIYPLQSLCYVVAILAGVFILKETIQMQQIFGMLFIIFGVIFISWKAGV